MTEQQITFLARSQMQKLTCYLMRKTGNKEDAEDIVQECFYRLQSKHNLYQTDNAKAYLYKVANNLLIDSYRNKIRTSSKTRHFLDQAFVEDPLSSPDRVLSSKEELRHVGQAIVHLPEKCQQAFILSRFYGYNYEQVASHMDISIKTVEKHISRALKTCQQSLLELSG
jgi:RNA polymerase sigma-70 factor (ECF subfamily)